MNSVNETECLARIEKHLGLPIGSLVKERGHRGNAKIFVAQLDDRSVRVYLRTYGRTDEFWTSLLEGLVDRVDGKHEQTFVACAWLSALTIWLIPMASVRQYVSSGVAMGEDGGWEVRFSLNPTDLKFYWKLLASETKPMEPEFLFRLPGEPEWHETPAWRAVLGEHR
jgi:hypothetical protein